MAARQGGPLMLVTGALGDPARAYLKATKPTQGFVMGGLDEGVVTSVFGQASH